jgi:hypothetical protein
VLLRFAGVVAVIDVRVVTRLGEQDALQAAYVGGPSARRAAPVAVSDEPQPPSHRYFLKTLAWRDANATCERAT